MSSDQRIADNVARIRERIASAAQRSGRCADDITLVAVTKYGGPEQVHALLRAGCRDLGESRPQELWRKIEAIADASLRWHLIGHLQRNKIRRTIPLVTLIHSADSERLLQAINQIAGEMSRVCDVLLEVNISGDAAKHGFAPDELASLAPRLTEFDHLSCHGLMAMASFEGGIQRARRDFIALRELRDRLVEGNANLALDELSMGMSSDFEVAIEEGATIVRVGSALLE